MNAVKLAAFFAALMFVVVPVWADWDPGDPYKMHAPQLPDPNGWDVSFVNGPLGDDWLCTETGAVNDIHLWVSFRGDLAPSPEGVVGGFVEIWDNVPAGVDSEFSHPGIPLWGIGFDTNMPNVTMRWYEQGEQRWLEPGSGTIPPLEPDHFNTYQINISPISDVIAPFIQREGETYWLVSHMFADDPAGPGPLEIGWKTSLTQYYDDAVYQSPLFPGWAPLEDPFAGHSLDLAFVITSIPEPATVVLLMIGAGVLAMQRRRN